MGDIILKWFPLFIDLTVFSYTIKNNNLNGMKPSVVYKTPFSYCFKDSYLLMFSYLFPAEWTYICQNQSLVNTT